MKKNSQNRRKFLTDCGKMSSLPVLSTMLNMSMFNSIMGARPSGSITDYKAIIYCFMQGGNDSFNMLIPTRNSEYNAYANIRRSFAHERKDIIPLKSDHPQQLGVPNSMREVANMFDDGDLSFVANVGALVEPLTISQFRNGSRTRPHGLFAHDAQQRVWHSSFGLRLRGQEANRGWIGRMLDILNEGANAGSEVNPSIVVGGGSAQRILRGASVSPFSAAGGTSQFRLHNQNNRVRDVVDASLRSHQDHVLQAHYNYVREETIEQTEFIRSIERGVDFEVPFPDDDWGRQFEQIANYIANRDLVGHKRQSFVAGRGGFDGHRSSRGGHSGMMGDLSKALYALNAALKQLGVHDKVVVCTGSDFGRTLSPNGSGTDHGWGGNHIVMGAVQGGKIFGEYPERLGGGSTDVGRGRQLPTTAIDQYHATIARWYGISASEMNLVIPHANNFPNNGVLDGMFLTPFEPNPNLEYHLDVPNNGVRLFAQADSSTLSSLPMSRSGINSRWKFVKHEATGLYYIERAGGGSSPRIRNIGQTNPVMQQHGNKGGRFVIFPNPNIPGTFTLDVPAAPSDFRRLRITANGNVSFVSDSNAGNAVSFKLTPA